MSEVKRHEWPAFPQHADWQTDMDAFINNPGKYGAPTMHGAGITMRDYFAAKAMEALIMSSDAEHNAQRLSGERGFKTISEAAYCAADAMLEAREKP